MSSRLQVGQGCSVLGAARGTSTTTGAGSGAIGLGTVSGSSSWSTAAETLVAGLAGADVQGVGVVSWMYAGGIEGGIELYDFGGDILDPRLRGAV